MLSRRMHCKMKLLLKVKCHIISTSHSWLPKSILAWAILLCIKTYRQQSERWYLKLRCFLETEPRTGWRKPEVVRLSGLSRPVEEKWKSSPGQADRAHPLRSSVNRCSVSKWAFLIHCLILSEGEWLQVCTLKESEVNRVRQMERGRKRVYGSVVLWGWNGRRRKRAWRQSSVTAIIERREIQVEKVKLGEPVNREKITYWNYQLSHDNW